MGVAGLVAVGVVNDDDAAIAAAPARVVDDAVAGGAHGGAVCRLEVGAFVRADDVGDGVGSNGELMWS